MKKLVATLAAGALVLAVAPSVFAAGLDTGNTNVSVTVSEGTTITAPAAINVGSAFPGQTATSATQNLSWWSNQQNLQLSAKLDGALANGSNTIAADNVEISSADYAAWASLDQVRPVANIIDVAPATLEAASTSTFSVRVNVPSATEGTYAQTMTWTVE